LRIIYWRKSSEPKIFYFLALEKSELKELKLKNYVIILGAGNPLWNENEEVGSKKWSKPEISDKGPEVGKSFHVSEPRRDLNSLKASMIF